MLPVMKAARAKNILEIGIESGKSTQALLEYVQKMGGRLDCVDPTPLPEFDSESLRSKAEGRFHFHNDLSLRILPDLPRFDAALIDGDHNWYTVYNELLQIEALHWHDPIQQPVIFVHDIGWPYGRRDLYYDPASIPEEFRHSHEQKGILPNRSELIEGKGLNQQLWNADHEGGLKNGVLTGVEDYLAETALEYRFINLPMYYGLGILVTEQRLKKNESLQHTLDEYELSPSANKLLSHLEHLRSIELIFAQTLNWRLQAAEDYIEQLPSRSIDS